MKYICGHRLTHILTLHSSDLWVREAVGQAEGVELQFAILSGFFRGTAAVSRGAVRGGALVVKQRVQVRIVETGSFHEVWVHAEWPGRQPIGVAPSADLRQPESKRGGVMGGVRGDGCEKAARGIVPGKMC